MQTVRDIQDLKNAVNQYGEMIVVKNNNGNDVMIMSIEEYRKMKIEKDIEKDLLEAEEDIENGKVYDSEEVFEEWDKKYGV